MQPPPLPWAPTLPHSIHISDNLHVTISLPRPLQIGHRSPRYCLGILMATWSNSEKQGEKNKKTRKPKGKDSRNKVTFGFMYCRGRALREPWRNGPLRCCTYIMYAAQGTYAVRMHFHMHCAVSFFIFLKVNTMPNMGLKLQDQESHVIPTGPARGPMDWAQSQRNG